MNQLSHINKPICRLAILSLVALFPTLLTARGNWSVSTSALLSRGSYTLESATETWYLYGGIRYRTEAWSVSANLPFVAQNGDGVTNSGGTFLPSGHHGDSGADGSHHNDGMMGGAFSDMDMGLGDLYLRGEYRLLRDSGKRPWVGATIKVKVPTASTAHNFGTGKPDIGGSLALRKRFADYLTVFEAGRWFLGSPVDVDYADPWIFGAGAGRFFDGGRYGVLLYYETYTAILSGFEPNRQISLGLNYRAGNDLVISLIGSGGLSETSPDYGLSCGMEWTL